MVNGMAYIGQTMMTVEKRWKYHCYKNSTCRFLSSAIKKYGENNFKIEILEETERFTKEELVKILNALEIKLISLHNTMAPDGYNLNIGGTGTWSDKKHKKKGPPRKWSEETRIKYKQTKTGMKYKEKTPEEYIENAERNSRTHFKSIKCNETGQIWNSIMECANFFDVKPKQISRVLKGQRKRLKWEYTFSYLPKEK